MLSKYALDFARHSLAASTVAPRRAVLASARASSSSTASTAANTGSFDTRLGYRVGRWEVYADGLNLLDTDYQEIRGVAMPGRSVRFGLRIR